MRINDNNRFKSFFGVVPRDRTGTLKNIVTCTTSRPMPTQEKIEEFKNVTFQECIDDQINKIKEHEMKDLLLLWSGGIDSTTVFYALVEANIEFSIGLSTTTIMEYPMLAKKIMNNSETNEFPTLKTFTMINNCPDGFFDNKLVITGEIGDQLVGSIQMAKYTDAERKLSYKEVLDEDNYKLFDDIIKNLVHADDLTLGEFLWGMNFIFKYEGVLDRMKTKPFFGASESFNFFDSELFQIWSINNYKTNTNFERQIDYKKVYKQYIYDINGDELYYKYKKKVISLPMIYR